jgi:hypothetical protein
MKYVIVTAVGIALDGESYSHTEKVEDNETLEQVRENVTKEIREYFESQLMAMVIHIDEFKTPEPVIIEKTTQVDITEPIVS